MTTNEIILNTAAGETKFVPDPGVANGEAQCFDGASEVSLQHIDDACCPDALIANVNRLKSFGKTVTYVRLSPRDFDSLSGCIVAINRYGSDAENVRAMVVAKGLGQASDQQLRAECERRGVSPDYEGMSPKFWKDCADDWQKRYEELCKAESAPSVMTRAELVRDRNEWKRRAEAAEAMERPAPVAAGMGLMRDVAQTHGELRVGDTVRLGKLGFCCTQIEYGDHAVARFVTSGGAGVTAHTAKAADGLATRVSPSIDPLECQRLETSVSIDTPEKLGAMLAGGRIHEVGPGIVALPPPDEDHYVDPVDLLADDE